MCLDQPEDGEKALAFLSGEARLRITHPIMTIHALNVVGMLPAILERFRAGVAYSEVRLPPRTH